MIDNILETSNDMDSDDPSGGVKKTSSLLSTKLLSLFNNNIFYMRINFIDSHLVTSSFIKLFLNIT